MFKRAASLAFQRVLNQQPIRPLRHVSHGLRKTVTGPAFNQESFIPQFLETEWPTDLNLNYLLMDKAFQPPTPDVNEAFQPPTQLITGDNKTRNSFKEFNKLDSHDEEVHMVMKTLYLALGRNELGDIIKAFISLRDLDALEKFLDTDVGKLSLMLAEYLSRAPKATERTEAEAMAMFFATRGVIEPLQAAMTYHLLRDDPDSVLGLWDQPQSWKRVPIRKPGKTAFRDERLLYVTAAAAMKDDYPMVVMAFRASSFSFAPWRISEFVERFLSRTSPLVRQRFLDFLHDASLARDIYQFHPLAQQVVGIGQLADHIALSDLYNSIKDCLDRGVFVISDTQSSDSHVQTVSRKIWSLFVWGAIQCRKVPLAEAFMQDMRAYGLAPTLDMWSDLLKGYAKRGLIDNMMETVKKIKDQGLEPNIKCLTVIMGAFYDKRLLGAATEIFHAIQAYPPPPDDSDSQDHISQLRVAHNVALNGLLRNRQIAEANTLLQKMEEEGPEPDIVTYNTFLNRYTNMKDTKGVAAVLRTISDRGLQPDIYTFTILYVTAARNRDEDMKINLLMRMKTLDVKPNNALFCAAICSMLGSGSSDAIRIAMGLLKSVEKERDTGIRPDGVTYHTIMHSVEDFVARGTLSEEQGFMLIQDLYRRMVSHRFQPTRVIHHLLLRTYLRRTDPHSLPIAISIFNQLVKEELANNNTWYILLSGLVTRREFALAKHMVAVLQKSSFEARGSLLAIVERINRY